MLPSGGSTTVVLPLRMWSPLNSRLSSSSSRHRWLAAWPGVWITCRVWVVVWPSGARCSSTSSSSFCSTLSGVNWLAARAVGADGSPRVGTPARPPPPPPPPPPAPPPAPGPRAERWRRGGAGRVVGVRVGADDHADVAAGGAPEPVEVLCIGRAGVDGDEARG